MASVFLDDRRQVADKLVGPEDMKDVPRVPEVGTRLFDHRTELGETLGGGSTNLCHLGFDRRQAA